MALPPGTILQRLYLRRRLKHVRPGRFVEVGTGTGDLAELLIGLGWQGVGYELNPDAAATARRRNPTFEVREADWLDAAPEAETADLVISSMVIEHLVDDDEAKYFQRAAEWLRPGGMAVVLTPGSPAHWGVEDDIAGHQRRYTRKGMADRLRELGWKADHLVGLTYPLSNLLLPISNRLVARAELDRLQLSERDRTVLSGNRDVPGKTSLPPVADVLVNEMTMYPWHLLQRLFADHRHALVLYLEARPIPG
jgi:SAM-dependent methyltransferase